MSRLKDRNRQIPNGFIFLQPETQWKPPPFASFQTIVDSLIAHRVANPYLVQKHGWTTDQTSVANEVAAFNARVCEVMGWNDYIEPGDGGAPSVPFPSPTPSLSGRLSQLAAGGKILVKWIASGAEAVAPELSHSRASVCVQCPLNGKGDWTSFFTQPVSNAIVAALEDRKQMQLSTPLDDQLGVCEACSCPLKLKVHMKIEPILADMPYESFDALAANCWIRAEKK